MNCAGDETDAEDLDLEEFWTPWEILGSYWIEDCVNAYLDRDYGDAAWN